MTSDIMDVGDTGIEGQYQQADRVLGKRWTILIVRTLLAGPCRFSRIGTAVGALSDRTLSVRLGELESHGIVERRVDGEAKPVRVEYALTAKGRALEPVLRELDRWADRWLGAPTPKSARRTMTDRLPTRPHADIESARDE